MKSISYKELPKYAPGQMLGSGDGRGWCGLNYRSYRHLGMEIELPPMDDFLIIGFDKGHTPVRRRVDNKWSDLNLAPGDLTLLTKAQKSEWSWSQTVDVSHVYLQTNLVEEIANEVFEQEVRDIRLRDVLRTRDAGISRCIAVIREEASDQNVGGPMIVEAAARELAVRLLRRYAEADFLSGPLHGYLSRSDVRRVQAFVHDHINEKVSYQEAAAETGLGAWSFMRKFKTTFGRTFHDYVLCQRVELAIQQLQTTRKPLKTIALDCGFYDQPHMNRVFKKFKGTTPTTYRRT